MSRWWKANFFILWHVIFLVRLQGIFEIDHPWEWKGLGNWTLWHYTVTVSKENKWVSTIQTLERSEAANSNTFWKKKNRGAGVDQGNKQSSTDTIWVKDYWIMYFALLLMAWQKSSAAFFPPGGYCGLHLVVRDSGNKTIRTVLVLHWDWHNYGMEKSPSSGAHSFLGHHANYSQSTDVLLFIMSSAIGQIMLLVDGMNGVINHSETIQWLYSLIASRVS